MVGFSYSDFVVGQDAKQFITCYAFIIGKLFSNLMVVFFTMNAKYIMLVEAK